jgi:hypothetical protein
MGTDKQHLITASSIIAAPPGRVYAILADYREGHASILPSQFTSMAVEHGGLGAGTIIRFTIRLLGRRQTFRAAITEPEPGRVLVETGLDENGAVTTFIVDQGSTPGQSRATITTRLKVRGGLVGRVERFFSTRLLYPVYVRELELLRARATATS